MAKLKQPEDFLVELGIDVTEHEGGTFMGRHIRLLYTGIFQIGDDDFDRWANSVELSFDLAQAKGQRQFRRWLIDWTNS